MGELPGQVMRVTSYRHLPKINGTMGKLTCPKWPGGGHFFWNVRKKDQGQKMSWDHQTGSHLCRYNNMHFGGLAGFLDLLTFVIGLPIAGRYGNKGKKMQWDMEHIWIHTSSIWDGEKTPGSKNSDTPCIAEGRAQPKTPPRSTCLKVDTTCDDFPCATLRNMMPSSLVWICPKKSWIEHLVAGGQWVHLDDCMCL